MKKSLVFVSVMFITLLLVFSACITDPVKATEKDMLKYGEFFTDYNIGNEAVRFKLTLNKDHTYSLYIKDYESTAKEEMKTYTGNWSHILTYEYKYCTSFGSSSLINETHTATIGIYLLEGYEVNNSSHYFVYEKSTGRGGIHSTKEQLTEDYLEKHREPCSGIAKYKKRVELSMIIMEADKK